MSKSAQCIDSNTSASNCKRCVESATLCLLDQGEHMATTRIDVAGLYAALDAQRGERKLSWRQLAKEIGVSPSLMSRLANGYRPDADGFATLVRWLNISAESFMIDDDAQPARDEPELVTQLAPLLRARNDLEPEDVTYLEDIIRATVRRAKAQRREGR